jgi:hypothetical protein
MSGSGGDAGYDFQADVIAFIAAHGLAGQPLVWFDHFNDVPAAWLAETSGPGDDIRVITLDGRSIEIQAKHALTRGGEYNETLQKLLTGLKNSPLLRGILLIDRHSSQIIRDDLKHDIVRLGQGRKDGLAQITIELLAHLREINIDDSAVFARFCIAVVDLDEGSDGVATAVGLLSRVVSAKDSPVAYALLGKRGHGLIKRRGRDDVHRSARFLDEALGLAQTEMSPAISTTRFANWIHSTNAQFYSPALQEQFPIHSAWGQLISMDSEQGEESPTSGIDLLEAGIKRYQEWTRLVHSNRRDGTVSADVYVNSHRMTVIVGGPGSGKTTLGRKLAFVATEDRLAVRVRLSAVAAMLTNGNTFERALAEAAMDSSGWNEKTGSAILPSAHILIADGLDECDPRRVDVAAGLTRWAASHPHTSICVLTRPVGHVPAMLPGFKHAELLPLETKKIREIAGWMIASKITDASRCSKFVAEFMNKLEGNGKNDVASIAARNPLLLSFLVRLFLDGQPIEGRRSALFERVIELIWNSPPLDRNISHRPIDHATAWAAAESAGWSCIEKPERRVTAIYQLISARLGGGVDAARRAEFSIRRWQDHGLIERLTVGSLDALVFVHLGLGEYLAGRQLVQLGSSEFEQFIKAHRRKAKWREPILLAAGAGAAERVIETLLPLDSPDDPESTDALLAAAALAEGEPGAVPRLTIERLAERLKRRLSSPIPLIAIEAGIGLISVSEFAPDLVGSIAMEFWEDAQPWTKLAANCAGLASGSDSIPIEWVVKWVKEFTPSNDFSFGSRISEWPVGSSDLQKSALPIALKRVAKELPITEAEGIVIAFLTGTRISMALMEAAQSGLVEQPYKSWVEKAERNLLGTMPLMLEGMKEFHEVSRSVQQIIMDGVLEACGRERDLDANHSSGYLLLATLLSSMDFWDLPLSDVAPIRLAPSTMLVEVLRGMISSLALDVDKLAEEVSSFLNRSQTIFEIQQIKVEPDWESVRKFNLNVQLLADAMQYESWFLAWSGARLFQMCSEQTSRQELLKDILLKGKGRTLMLVGLVSDQVWGNDAFQLLHNRLGDPLSLGCGFLYGPMIRNANTPEMLDAAVLRTLEGIANQDPEIAQDAAEGLRVVDGEILARHREQLRGLFDHWKHRGSWCDRCNRAVYGSSCDKCHVVPPQPRKHLVYLLYRSDALSFDVLIDVMRREMHGEAEEARRCLVEWASGDQNILDKLIAHLRTEIASELLLNELLKQSVDQLRQMSQPLLMLLDSSSAIVRAKIITSFSSKWIDGGLARELAQKALLDEAPRVRTAAATVLRGQSQT